MPKSNAFEILLESQGETLTVGDVHLKTAGFDKSGIEGISIRSGETECLTISGTSEHGTAGNLSIFAGSEKIGTLNWDCTDPIGEVPADWTPLSKNFTTSVIKGSRAGVAVERLILRVARPLSARMSANRMDVASGHLGFAGI